METWVIALLVKPLMAFGFLVLVLLLKTLVDAVMPDSRLKRWLFLPRGGQR